MNPDREERLMTNFAQLAGHVMANGLEHARADDPHAYAQATKWLQAGGGAFELRVKVASDGSLTVNGLIADDDEAVISVFEIRAAESTEH